MSKKMAVASMLAMTASMMGGDILPAKYRNRKPHWKEEQSDDDKNDKLARAEAKRERKRKLKEERIAK